METNETKNKGKKVISSVVLLLTFITLILAVFVVYKSKIIEKNIEFKIFGNENVILEIGQEYEETGFTACIFDIDLTDRVRTVSNLDITTKGKYEIVYSIKNFYLNVDMEFIRTIEVVDTQKPELTINSEKEITINVDDEFEYPSYTAIDNCDGDITSKVVVESSLNTSKKGTYKIDYLVQDSSGNESTDSIVVKVKAKKNPYIVVSITNQTLKYYEYGEVVLSSDVVTGINGKTPTGTFKILNKAQKIILRGADYESFVNYWMAFCGASFGFHDASWRSKFGGTIYKTNGSHGCVNMPYAKVKQLYNMVSIGTPVYINK